MFKWLRSIPIVNRTLRNSARVFLKATETAGSRLVKHIPLSGIISVRFAGVTSRFFSKSDDYILKQYYFGKHDEPGTDKLLEILAPRSGNVFDVGANTGFVTVNVANANPSARVFAFEPVPAIMARLKKNCQINGLQNVTLVPKAVSDQSGSITIYIPRTEISYSASATPSFHDAANVVPAEVETTTLDEFVAEHSIKGVDLLKVDVEWHEHEVLRGAVNILQKYSPVIILEVLFPEVEVNKNPTLKDLPKDHHKKIQELLENYGYCFYKITSEGVIRMDAIEPSYDERNYFFSKKRSSRQFISFKERELLISELLP